jgi:hypothetical protein
MALNEKSRLYTPVALESASQAIIWGSGSPDGSEAPHRATRPRRRCI